MIVRRYEPRDRPAVWSLNHIPFRGATADPSAPIPLPAVDSPGHFADLEDVLESFVAVGGEFLVAELNGEVIGVGGIRGNDNRQAEVLRVRVHPAVRRQGVGRALMEALEDAARQLGFEEMHLDTTVDQPEAIAFYRSRGYSEVGRETFPAWELVYFTKPLSQA